MDKKIKIFLIFLSILVLCCAGASAQSPLTEKSYSRFGKFVQPGGFIPQPNVTIDGVPPTNPMSTPDQIPILFNGVISKTKAISIAKNYCNIIAFRTTAKLDWLFSLEPTDPVWVVTMYGKEIIDNKPGKTVTKVVKINGYTGAVISVN